MNETEGPTPVEKLEWDTPQLESVGRLDDVEAGAGLNSQGGLAGS